MTDSASDSKSTPETTTTSRPLPTLEVGIGTVIATVANQIEGHPGIQAVLTSAAPILGVVMANTFRFVASLMIREILINGAKAACKEIQAEINATTQQNRTGRVKELERQLDEARQTLNGLRTQRNLILRG